MPGTMSRADLAADLKAALHDAANYFKAPDNADFARLLDAAALDLSRYRLRVVSSLIMLVADQPTYPAPDDLLSFRSAQWSWPGEIGQPPWRRRGLERMPEVSAADGLLQLSPAPSAGLIAARGAALHFTYHAAHRIGTDAPDTTVRPTDRALLLLRAQVEAMRELAVHLAGKSTQAVPATGGQPRNGTPAALADLLFQEFLRGVG